MVLCCNVMRLAFMRNDVIKEHIGNLEERMNHYKALYEGFKRTFEKKKFNSTEAEAFIKQEIADFVEYMKWCI